MTRQVKTHCSFSPHYTIIVHKMYTNTRNRNALKSQCTGMYWQLQYTSAHLIT